MNYNIFYFKLIYLFIYVMDTFILVLFNTIDDETFNLLNNLISEQLLSFDILSTQNNHKINLLSNDSSFNIQEFLHDKISESLNIITYDDYKSLINIMYNEQHSIIKYNNINILQITSFYKFDTTPDKLSTIKNNFSQIINSNNSPIQSNNYSISK